MDSHASVRRSTRVQHRASICLGLLLLIAMVANLASRPPATQAAGLAQLVKDIKGLGASNPWELTAHGATVFFTADDGVHGRELWKTNGTAAGTVMVADINPGPAGAFEYYGGMLTSFKGYLIFSANDGVHGFELWKTDGTTAGTSLLKDIVPGDVTSRAHALTVVGDTMFFVAEESVHGSELWKTDGSAAGTVLVKDLTPNDTGYDHEPESLVNVNGTLYFTYDGGVYYGDIQLWKSDGTEAGTAMMKSFPTTGPNAYVSQFTPMGGLVFFIAINVEGGDLWKTDGTPAGTQPVKDVSTMGEGLRSLTLFNGQLYFFADNWGAQGALWKSDGTAAGTVMVKNITDSGNSYANSLTILHDHLVFIAESYPVGRELWVSDGTAAGTTVLKDINPTSENTWFTIKQVLGALYLGPSDGVHGRELWVSDGTASGTSMIQDIVPGATGSDPDNFMAVNGFVLFTADDVTHGRELWSMPATNSFDIHIYVPLIQR